MEAMTLTVATTFARSGLTMKAVIQDCLQTVEQRIDACSSAFNGCASFHIPNPTLPACSLCPLEYISFLTSGSAHVTHAIR